MRPTFGARTFHLNARCEYDDNLCYNNMQIQQQQMEQKHMGIYSYLRLDICTYRDVYICIYIVISERHMRKKSNDKL